METISSFTQGKKHFLKLLQSLPPLPVNAILVVADVTPLHTNTPHKEGTQSVLHYTKLYANTLSPGALSPNTIGISLETILK